MLKAGKRYEFITVEADDEGYGRAIWSGTVTMVDGHLIEIDGHTVLNLASPMFHSATDKEAEKAYLDEVSARMAAILEPDTGSL